MGFLKALFGTEHVVSKYMFTNKMLDANCSWILSDVETRKRYR